MTNKAISKIHTLNDNNEKHRQYSNTECTEPINMEFFIVYI